MTPSSHIKPSIHVTSPTSPDNNDKPKRMRRGHGTKGKRVHLCAQVFDNGTPCDQTFSRAEHLRFDIHLHEVLTAQWAKLLLRRHMSRVHALQSTSQNSNDATDESASSDQSQALLANIPPTIEMRASTTESTEEAELFYYWAVLYSSKDNRVQRYVKEESEWALSCVPKICAQHDGIKGIVLSIAATQLSYQAPHSRYRTYMSQFGHQKAIEQVRQGIDEVAAMTANDQLPKRYLEQLLVASYLLAIRIQISTSDITASSATSLEKLQALLLRFNAARGFYNLMQRIFAVCPQIVETEFWRYVIDVQRRNSGLTDALSPSIPRASTRTYRHFDALLANLNQDESASTTNLVYRNSITILEWVYDSTITEGFSDMAIARWRYMFCLLPGDLIPMLQSQDSRSLAILAHCLCLERSPNLTENWWVMRHVTPMIEAFADLVQPDWAWAMEWPLSVARGESDMRSSPVLKYEAHENRLRDSLHRKHKGRLPDRS